MVAMGDTKESNLAERQYVCISLLITGFTPLITAVSRDITTTKEM